MTENIGIHQIKNDHHCSSFFVQRPFGNYIFFADHLQEVQSDFLKEKGGVWRVFIEDGKNISQTHIHLFKFFGSYVVLNNHSIVKTHKDVPVEIRDVDFHDHSIDWDIIKNHHCVVLKQKDTKVILFGSSLKLDKNMQVFSDETNLSPWVSAYCSKNGIPLALFSKHEGNAVLKFS